MTRTRAADDFATIRARMDELRRESAEAAASQSPPPRRAETPLTKIERRLRERREGHPPHWVPTIFVKTLGGNPARCRSLAKPPGGASPA